MFAGELHRYVQLGSCAHSTWDDYTVIEDDDSQHLYTCIAPYFCLKLDGTSTARSRK